MAERKGKLAWQYHRGNDPERAKAKTVTLISADECQNMFNRLTSNKLPLLYVCLYVDLSYLCWVVTLP